jgi:ABC-type Fe3+/spermidine/putrescine transport system ATPase subunit
MIRVENILATAGAFRLGASLDIGENEYFVLAGQTGCGKTTLIECICGLRRVTAGRIYLGGEDVTDAEPRTRRVGYVPQDGALFTHLDVRGNVLFALKVAGVSRREADKAVRELAGKLSIEALLGRPIQGLSGGERQRVALARALAHRPRALLLDEPVSALDECSRDEVCRELMRVRAQFGIPVVHVCHSSEEARLVASRMAVMQNGAIVQTDTPEALYSRPRTVGVARFVRCANVFSGQGVRAQGASYIRVNGIDLRADAPEGALAFTIRPWLISPADRVAAGTAGTVIEGRLTEFALAGPVATLRLDGALPLVVHLARVDAEPYANRPGSAVRMLVPPGAVHVLEP